MPRLSVYFVRAALIYLLVGFTFGALMLANKGVLFSPWIFSLLPIHIEFLFMGWLVQLALGMAFWILPRMGSISPRGDERWSWATFILLNIGICFATLPLFLPSAGTLFLARLLETAGLLTFAIGNWRRIYPLKFPEFPSR